MGLVYKKIGNECFVRLFKKINYDVPILIFFILVELPNQIQIPMETPNQWIVVLNAAQSAQRREGIYILVYLNLDIVNFAI